VIENMEFVKGVGLRGEASFVNRRFPGFRMSVGFEQESAKPFFMRDYYRGSEFK